MNNCCGQCHNKMREAEDMDKSYYVAGYSVGYSSSATNSSKNSQPRTLPPETVAQRCQVAIEGRGNMVSIEGHSLAKKLNNNYK